MGFTPTRASAPAYNGRARRRYCPRRDRGSIRVEGATHRATCRRGAMKRYELLSIIGTILVVGIALGTVMITSNANLRTEVQTLRTEVNTEMQTLRTEVRADITDVRTEMQTLRAEVNTEMQALRGGGQHRDAGPAHGGTNGHRRRAHRHPRSGTPARGGGTAPGAHRRSARRAARRDHGPAGRASTGAAGVDLSPPEPATRDGVGAAQAGGGALSKAATRRTGTATPVRLSGCPAARPRQYPRTMHEPLANGLARPLNAGRLAPSGACASSLHE